MFNLTQGPGDDYLFTNLFKAVIVFCAISKFSDKKKKKRRKRGSINHRLASGSLLMVQNSFHDHIYTGIKCFCLLATIFIK